jgi:hypothetical protein
VIYAKEYGADPNLGSVARLRDMAIRGFVPLRPREQINRFRVLALKDVIAHPRPPHWLASSIIAFIHHQRASRGGDGLGGGGGGGGGFAAARWFDARRKMIRAASLASGTFGMYFISRRTRLAIFGAQCASSMSAAALSRSCVVSMAFLST